MNQRGQSLIETCIFVLVAAPLIGMMLGFTRWFHIREKLLLAAWQGAALYSSGCIARSEVDATLRNFLSHGSPAMDPRGIHITLGRAPGWSGKYYQLDLISVAYTSPDRWSRLLDLAQTQEETCTIAHSPHYWDPIMDLYDIPHKPKLYGPAYPW